MVVAGANPRLAGAQAAPAGQPRLPQRPLLHPLDGRARRPSQGRAHAGRPAPAPHRGQARAGGQLPGRAARPFPPAGAVDPGCLQRLHRRAAALLDHQGAEGQKVGRAVPLVGVGRLAVRSALRHLPACAQPGAARRAAAGQPGVADAAPSLALGRADDRRRAGRLRRAAAQRPARPLPLLHLHGLLSGRGNAAAPG